MNSNHICLTVLASVMVLGGSAFAAEPLHSFTCSSANGSTDTIYKLNIQNGLEVYYEAGNTNVGFLGNGIYAKLDNSVPHNDLMSPEKMLPFKADAGHSLDVQESLFSGEKGRIQVTGSDDYQTGTFNCFKAQPDVL
jgi:hypothetical protein